MDERLRIDTSTLTPTLYLSGQWGQAQGIPDTPSLLSALQVDCKVLNLDGSGIVHWDTTLAAFLKSLERGLSEKGIKLVADPLPKGVQRLMSLIRNAKPSVSLVKAKPKLTERIGAWGYGIFERVAAWLWLVGMCFTALSKLLVGKNRVPFADILDQIIECGPRALGIVTLLSFLIGGILAFVGVVQLRIFGAEIYMADLVGMGMLLEMGALMTGIIMAGRAGASFAAAIGTMQTNEEVDALQTLGFDPVEFLVMPRVLALTLMAPLLVLYADLLGILGGAACLGNARPISALVFLRDGECCTCFRCGQGADQGNGFRAGRVFRGLPARH
jgi:phospholipid/cholesterol/gamma-HCH transport system permease protein